MSDSRSGNDASTLVDERRRARRRLPAPSLTFQQLKYCSFTHSVVYLCLLVVWIVPGLHGAEFVFGLAHGIGWIVMCVLCIAAVHARVIGLRLAVAVAVIGAIGPFVGSWEFVREGRRRRLVVPRPVTSSARHRPIV